MHQVDLHLQNDAGATTYREVHRAPASWSEMTREHLLLWASAMGTKLQLRKASNALAAHFYKMPVKLFKYIPETETKRLSKSLDFLFGKNLLSTWLIPSFRKGLFKYHGPKNGLANLTINEYSLCEQCYEQFDITKNLEYLDTLAGIMYRPRRFWGIDDDIRCRLTNYGYVNRAKRFKTLPLHLKIAIYLNYEGCRNFLHNKYKDVFLPSEKGKKPQKTQAVTPWPKIIESAANDIFGPMTETEDTNLQKFLSRLGTRMKEQKEFEEKYAN